MQATDADASKPGSIYLVTMVVIRHVIGMLSTNDC